MSVLPSLNSIKVGLNILVGGEPYQVQTANFVRMQQRKPVMQTKMKNLINGKVLEYSFKAGERVEEADLEKGKGDYLYTDQSGVYFMDSSTFEQLAIDPDFLRERTKLLKEGMQVDILYFNGKPITISFPPKIELHVTSTPPGIKGDSAGNVTKQATLETGLIVNVPLFVKEGDTIRVNTETLEYTERVAQ
jgi:elongation factor P